MADKKLTPQDLLTATGGASKDVPGDGSDKLSDSLSRLRHLLASDDDFKRVRYAGLTEKELASVLGAGTSAVANALGAHGVEIRRRAAMGSPPVADVREDKDTAGA